MKEQMQHFEYLENKVNVILDENGEPWFDATNVCSIIGYSRSASNILERLESDEKKLIDRQGFDPTSSVGSPGAIKKWFVNEPGLYTLILGSEKPEAKNFKRWVTHEVLPSIRKTGAYSTVKKQLIWEEYRRRYLLNTPDIWRKQFPDIYHEEVCRLFNLKKYVAGDVMPGVVGKFTKHFVYKCFPAELLEEIQEKNPLTYQYKDGKISSRKYKNHQFCSEEAKIQLKDQIKIVTKLIQASAYDFQQFKVLFNNSFPKNKFIEEVDGKELNLILDGQMTFFDEFSF